jgi:hypothetical protein
VNDLGVVANLGNLQRFSAIYQRIRKTKNIDILFLGGSITAGGYFMEFIRLLRNDGFNVTFHNHGHGATELTCKTYDYYYTVDETYSPLPLLH